MSKTFKANPTTDKHNLRKRILEIESNPITTTTTTSTVTKITSDDVGNGLVVDGDKLNLDLGPGLSSTSGKADITIGDGLEIVGDKVKINFDVSDAGHLKYDATYGIIVKSNVLTARNLAPSVTWGDTLEFNTSTLRIEVKDNSIKPVKLDIANEAMFRAMCVNRTVWVEFANASLSPSVAMGIHFFWQLSKFRYFCLR